MTVHTPAPDSRRLEDEGPIYSVAGKPMSAAEIDSRLLAAYFDGRLVDVLLASVRNRLYSGATSTELLTFLVDVLEAVDVDQALYAPVVRAEHELSAAGAQRGDHRGADVWCRWSLQGDVLELHLLDARGSVASAVRNVERLERYRDDPRAMALIALGIARDAESWPTGELEHFAQAVACGWAEATAACRDLHLVAVERAEGRS